MTKSPLTLPLSIIVLSVSSLLATGQQPGPFSHEPLVIKEKGRFIEITRGVFLRNSTITDVAGSISFNAHAKKRVSGTIRVSRDFPLSLAGIKELRKVDRSEMVKEFRPEANKEDIEYELSVTVQINDQRHTVISSVGKDPLEFWDEFEKAAIEAVAELDRLIELASKGEQAGAGQPATKPADKAPVKDQPSTPTSKDAPR